MAQRTVIDSNETRLRWAVEDSPKSTSGDERWFDADPNSYGDFGAGFGKLARRPIQASRQLKKGSTVSLEVPANWNADLTLTNNQELLQGFVYSTLSTAKEVQNSAADTEIINVDGTTEIVLGSAAADLDGNFPVGSLIRMTNFGVAQNNTPALTFDKVTAVAADSITVNRDLATEAVPPIRAKITKVGHEFTAGAVDVVIAGNFATYTAAGTGQNSFLHLEVVPGEFIFVGGDTAGTRLPSAVNNGWKRVRSVSATALVVDKSTTTMVDETPASETLQIFVGRVLKDQADPTLIVRRTYRLERTLGPPDDASTDVIAEYITGATPNTFQINIPNEDKVNCDLGFVGAGYHTLGPVPQASLESGASSGGIQTLASEDAFNTSSDFSVVKVHVVDAANENPTEVVAFVENLTLSINNNVTENKAVGVLGSARNSVGAFQVSGSITGYFSRLSAVNAVKDNADVTLHAIMAAQNVAIAVDLPLVALGDARLAVEQDVAIKIPLNPEAAEATKVDAALNHTIMFVFFDYVPSAAL